MLNCVIAIFLYGSLILSSIINQSYLMIISLIGCISMRIFILDMKGTLREPINNKNKLIIKTLLSQLICRVIMEIYYIDNNHSDYINLNNYVFDRYAQETRKRRQNQFNLQIGNKLHAAFSVNEHFNSTLLAKFFIYNYKLLKTVN